MYIDYSIYPRPESIRFFEQYIEILEQYPSVNEIVTISNWNGYTHQAKEAAKKQCIGIFIMNELLGALNWNEPYKYIKYDDKGKPIFYGKY